jgi:N-acetylglucosaminyl-diphospho-decaprenol L-rhamnosyltransferase
MPSIANPPQTDDRSGIQSNSRSDVSVIVVSYNTVHLLDRMLSALADGSGSLSLQIIVVDNASIDGSLDVLRAKHPDVELIENPTNVGFGRANNQAIERVRGRHVLLLNTDAFLTHDTLPKTVEYMDTHPECGVLGVRLVGEDGILQPSCRYFPTPWNIFLNYTGLHWLSPKTRMMDDLSWDHGSVRACDWVPGCYYLVRGDVIDRVGLFDPRYFLYYEEIDHCQAVRQAGWKVIFYPYSKVVHFGGESARTEESLSSSGRQISSLEIESELLYFRKHNGVAGVLAAAILGILGDGIVICKCLIKMKRGAQIVAASRHAWNVLTILLRTRLASRPTR